MVKRMIGIKAPTPTSSNFVSKILAVNLTLAAGLLSSKTVF